MGPQPPILGRWRIITSFISPPATVQPNLRYLFNPRLQLTHQQGGVDHHEWSRERQPRAEAGTVGRAARREARGMSVQLPSNSALTSATLQSTPSLQSIR